MRSSVLSPLSGGRGLAVALACVLSTSSIAGAQTDSTPRPAAAGPAVRRISTASAVSAQTFGNIVNAVELRDGRVLVNDGVSRRLLLLDTTLTKTEIVLDSLAEVANTYGNRAGAMIPYRGDSVLFIDPMSMAMLVLDPEAKIARVRSIWRVQDVGFVTSPNGVFGWPGTDARGRIVYRMYAMAAPPKVAPPAGVPYFPPDPDSAFVVAADLETRKIDTLGSIRIPKNIYQVKQTAEGYFSIVSILNPLPSTDDWAVLPDGSVAFVRARDYRIEYRAPDGTWTSSQKLPFDWQRMTEDLKQGLVDSVKKANERSQMTTYVAGMIRWVNMYKKDYPPNFKVPDGFVPAQGLMKDWKFPEGLKFPANYIYGCAPGVEPTMTPMPATPGGAATPPPAPPPMMPGMVMGGMPTGPAGIPSCIPQPITIAGTAPPMPTMREINIMPADELPDYRPPFGANSIRADVDGNLWIRTLPPKPVPGGLIYDVVNRQGELFDRLQLPPGYTLAGFGKGRVVYLSMRDAKGIHLARVRLK